MKTAETLDYERRFGGMTRLYGKSGVDRFSSSHVCVVGIGGVGSWAAEALARSAIGNISLIDLDHIAESNVNRQIHALEGQFGRSKVEAMGERITAINPICQVKLVDDFVDEENLERLITTDVDYLVDCIDAHRIKAALIAHCRRRKIRIITAGGAGGRIDPSKIRMADLSRSEQDPLLSRVRKQLRKEYGFPRNLKRRFEVPCIYSVESPRYPSEDGGICQEKRTGGVSADLNCGGFGSAMPVTATFALFAVSWVLQKLADPNASS
ncbi:MAG: tRNA cyclic N6-threonylcarbamoyladenosine(37) synthase TcdA [Gammaproteobacteria bacterium]|nr:tRNA cyclic N6-threonylcarbamoyladenosine(37) synthase TcdA [Gammaproteobacteria bacterium]